MNEEDPSRKELVLSLLDTYLRKFRGKIVFSGYRNGSLRMDDTGIWCSFSNPWHKKEIALLKIFLFVRNPFLTDSEAEDDLLLKAENFLEKKFGCSCLEEVVLKMESEGLTG